MAIQWTNRENALPTSAEEIAQRRGYDHWMMTDAERCTLATLIRTLRPECAIEVGTYRGGSLATIAQHSGKVFSLDIDPTFRDTKGATLENVEYVIGNSAQTLPELLKQIDRQNDKLGFVLIDADHSENGVRSDLNSLLEYRPRVPLYVLMHDSFNPGCRRGIKTANWAQNPHVHLVELDFVKGRLVTKEEGESQRSMWCGFGLAILLPEQRAGELAIHENEHLGYKAAYVMSVYPYQKVWNPFYALPKLRRSSWKLTLQALQRMTPGLYSSLRKWKNSRFA